MANENQNIIGAGQDTAHRAPKKTKSLRIFVDVDGTLTSKQCGNSAFRVSPRQDVIDKCKKLIKDGHEIIIWTGNTNYAKKAAKLYGINAIACVGKPHLIIDNEKRTWARRLKQRVILPEDFIKMEISPVLGEEIPALDTAEICHTAPKNRG